VADLWDLVRAHESWRGREAINLQPSENAMSPQARSLLASDFAHRYAMPGYASPFGDVGDAYRGTRYTVQVEALADRLARRVFSAAHATVKPLSGHLAGALLLRSACRPGDRVMIVAAKHGGYDGYMPGFLPHQIGLRVSFLPFDEAAWNVDPDAAAAAIRSEAPRLVLLGASHILFPYDLGPIRAACDDVNAVLGYDASHVLGLVAGGAFQRPMQEGTDILSASTHKTFPGPQGGLLLANRSDVFERAMAGVTWHIEDNAHWNRIASTAQVLLEMQAFGGAYATQVVANARALGAALDGVGFPVKFGDLGYTRSHQIQLDPTAIRARFGVTPHGLADRLEANNLIVDAVGRIGTNEVTRMGATEDTMRSLSDLLARAARGQDVRADVAAVRSTLRLSYAFESDPRERP
jgi:glycine hydroxymethyltransferase